jgi:hypothetical protein
MQRQATEAWVAIRRHTPFAKPEVAPPPPARTPVRDATASRGSHRRSK